MVLAKKLATNIGKKNLLDNHNLQIRRKSKFKIL